MKSTLILSCPIDTYSGYGARGRDLAKALIDLDKYDVKILPQRWGATTWGFIEDHKKDWGFLNEYLFYPQPNQQYPKPDIWIQLTIPNEFMPQGNYNIGITAGIESTIAPADWVEGCNRMDLILGSSKHTIDVLKSSKFQKHHNQTRQVVGNIELNTKTEVLFEGFNEDIFKKIDSNLDLSEIREEFCYLFVGHWIQGDLGHDRKNVGLLIKSFLETFKNKSKKPALILKTTHGTVSNIDKEKLLRKIQDIKNTVKGKLPNIYLFYGDISEEELNELYNHKKVKAMISLTKGEGFGRPLLEFTQTKKPIITTSWSGHIDFLKPDMSVLLPGTLGDVHPSAQNKWLIQGSKWFDVDTMALGKVLKDTYKGYKNYIHKAKQQGNYCKENFSYSKMVEKLDDILKENLPNFSKQVSLNLPKKEVNIPKLKLPKLKTVKI